MLLKIRVQPRASKQRVERQVDGTLKVWLQSAPQNGKANAELVEALAEHFNVKKNAVRLVSGAKSRVKTVEVAV
jgi:uncharacterized protein (TIGR00251 family)